MMGTGRVQLQNVSSRDNMIKEASQLTYYICKLSYLCVFVKSLPLLLRVIIVCFAWVALALIGIHL